MVGLIGTLVDNPMMAATMAAGGLAGGIGGAFIDSGSAGATVALSGGLAVAGVAGGALAGHYLHRMIDSNTPTPMGMRVASQPKMEAGKTVEVGFKPSVILADRAYDSFKASTKDDPAFADVAKQMPMISQFLSYSRMNATGTVSQDGKSMVISSVTFRAPFKDDIKVDIANVAIPLKDGKIDQESPEAKEAMQQILYQTIEQRIPKNLQEKAKAAADKLLSKADAQPDTPATAENDTQEKLLKGAKLALSLIQPDTPVDRFVNPNSGLPSRNNPQGRT